MKNRRTSKVIQSPEAKALRKIREDKGFSIRFVASKLNLSETYIRHIEKGRLDIPSKNFIRRLMRLYKISMATFNKEVLNIKETNTPHKKIKLIIDSLSDENATLILMLIKKLI